MKSHHKITGSRDQEIERQLVYLFRRVHLKETASKPLLSSVAFHMDVVLVRWPLERQRRDLLAEQGLLRLLLIEGPDEPPVPSDLFEDWIRVPATESDVQARIAAIRSRAGERVEPPELDPDGLLRFDGHWVSLPPVEARLVGALLGRFGGVVSRDQLSKSGWPRGAPGRNALDVHVLRLRRRIAPVGLSIKTVRSRGYLLEREPQNGSRALSDNGHKREPVST